MSNINYDNILSKFFSPKYQIQLENYKKDEFSSQSILQELTRIHKIIEPNISLLPLIYQYQNESSNTIIKDGNMPTDFTDLIKEQVELNHNPVTIDNITTLFLIHKTLKLISSEVNKKYWIIFGSPEVLLFICMYEYGIRNTKYKQDFANLLYSSQEYFSECMFMYVYYQMINLLNSNSDSTDLSDILKYIKRPDETETKLYYRNCCAFCWLKCFKESYRNGNSNIPFNFLYSLSLVDNSDLFIFALVNIFNTNPKLKYNWNTKISFQTDLIPYSISGQEVLKSNVETNVAFVYNPTDQIKYDFETIVRRDDYYYVYDPYYILNKTNENNLFNSLNDVKLYLNHMPIETKPISTMMYTVKPSIKWFSLIMILIAIVIVVIVSCVVSKSLLKDGSCMNETKNK